VSPEGRPNQSRPARAGQRGAGRGSSGGGGAPARGAGAGRAGKPGADRDSPRRPFTRERDARRTEAERTTDQRRYDGPEIPEAITGKELDRSVLAQLKSLPEKLGQRVARHLVAAGELLDSDPRTAYEHTLAARARASRLAVVREAVGEAAYAAGEYAEALAELRAAKRMNGAHDYVAIMADCERALGRPDRALTLLRNAPRDKFAPPLLAETAIVEAGARRDRGELDAALRTLENAHLSSQSRAPWVARVRYAYADTLLAAGRLRDALEWFHRTEAVDVEEITDAADRAAEVERRLAQD
jgi:tetratricopeptide (TPR) repeat protein